MTLILLVALICFIININAHELWNLQESEWRELEDMISGSVVLPSDSDYATTYVLWTATFDNVYPEAVVIAEDKYDVATIWQWLLTKTDDISSKLVTLRTCSHSFGGWSTSYGLVIDVKSLQTLQISDDEVLSNGETVKTAYVGPGVNLAMFTSWAEENDVTLPHGDCASVCFGGFLLGGGFGVTSRTFGMGIDWIKSMDVVLVDTGELVTISADNEYSDLFWAMKGAGQGQYAILTEYYMRIPWKQQTEAGLYISLEWDYTEDNWNQISQVWSEYVTNEDYGNHFAIYLRIQPVSTLGNDYYINFHGFWTGEQSDGLTMLASLYSDIGITPTSSNIEYDHFEGWIEPSNPNRYRYSSLCKSRFKVDSTELDTELFSGMYSQVDKLASYEVPSDQDSTDDYNYPTQFMFLAPAGGAIKYHTRGDSAFNWRDAEYLYVVCTRWEPTNADAFTYATTWLQETVDTLEPYLSSDASFVNFPDNLLPNALDLYYGDSLARLQTVKQKYNPDNIFQHPQSIVVTSDDTTDEDSDTSDESSDNTSDTSDDNSDIDNDDTIDTSLSLEDEYRIKPRNPNELTLYDEYLNDQLSNDGVSVLPLDKRVVQLNLNPKLYENKNNQMNRNSKKKRKKAITGPVSHVKNSLQNHIKNGDNKKLNQFKSKHNLNEISDDTQDTNSDTEDEPQQEGLSNEGKDVAKKTKQTENTFAKWIKAIPIWAYIILAAVIAIGSVIYWKRKVYNEKNAPRNTQYTKLNQHEDYVPIGSQGYSTFEDGNVVL